MQVGRQGNGVPLEVAITTTFHSSGLLFSSSSSLMQNSFSCHGPDPALDVGHMHARGRGSEN